MKFLTVHTLTYNRGYILEQAYRSLCAQTDKDFIWLITDDGSDDNTEEKVKEWQSQKNDFLIEYQKLDHQGLPHAYNAGLTHVRTPWYMRLDSDDFLKPITVLKIYSWIKEIEDLEKIVGIGFAKVFPDGHYMRDQAPSMDLDTGYRDATHLERKLYNLDMDMCEVQRTDVLKQYPLPCWPGETFAPEQLSFYAMALDGWKLRWRADKLYVCDYLPEGLTKDNSIVKHNPMGYAMMYNQNLLFHKGLKKRFIDAAQLIALCFYAGHLGYLKHSNAKSLTLLASPFGIALGIRRKLQFSKLK